MKPFVKSLCLFLSLLPGVSFSQAVINVYARVTAISGTSLTITGATGTFTAGSAIIMQMQDSAIGTNTGNNTGFGNLAAIRSAGLSEIVTITAATSTSITLSTAAVNTYHIINNGRVQIISYPTLGGGGNYTLTGGAAAPAWNGSTGGVVAFSVGGTLTISSNITVDGQGFRGGAVGTSAPSDLTCDPNTYYDNAGGVSTVYYGYKGEGIHNTNGAYLVAKGKMLNGGGGGNANNAGGGGGGNLTAGGAGGQGWSCSSSTSGAGVGGLDLSTYISGNRFFLGGGGGGGQQNNSVGTAGGNGGGIILIKANAIQTSAGCNGGAGNVSISAKGTAAPNSGNDGAGGGGAGGSILLQVGSYTVSGSCPLNINTSGGNGGNVTDAGAHGGGAGGGKGVSIVSGVVGVPTNTTITDNTGAPGADASTGVVSAGGGSPAATSGSGGIMYMPTFLLPVQLSAFAATALKNSALLQWQASIENNLAGYQVERSINDGGSYTYAGMVTAKGNSALYNFKDDLSMYNLNDAKVYYRLKMIGQDGNFEYSSVRAVSFSSLNTTVIKSFPNPAVAAVYITSTGIGTNPVPAAILDMQGRLVKSFASTTLNGNNTIVLSLDGIAKGQYIITIDGTNGKEHTVIMKQ